MKVFVGFLLIVVVAAVPAESACESGWLEFGGRCFLFSSDLKTWYDAERACLFMDAALVKITDEATNNFITSTLQATSGSSGIWIGITDTYTRGQYHWLDGTRVVSGYSNWLYAEHLENPTNFWRCAYIRRTTPKWERTACLLRGGNFICEK